VSGRGNVVTFQQELVQQQKRWEVVALGGNNLLRFRENICYLEQVSPNRSSSSGDHTTNKFSS
jgi:hypothetical protein